MRIFIVCVLMACADSSVDDVPDVPDPEPEVTEGPGPDAEGAANTTGMIRADGDGLVFQPCGLDKPVEIATWPAGIRDAFDQVVMPDAEVFTNLQVLQVDGLTHITDWHRMLPLAECGSISLAGRWEAVGDEPFWTIIVRDDDTVRLDTLDLMPSGAEYDLTSSGFDDASQAEVFRFDVDGAEQVLTIERALCLHKVNAYSRSATLEGGDETLIGCGRPL